MKARWKRRCNNGVPVAVYEQLIEAVHEMLPVLKKYLTIRKRVMGVDQLEMYDLYVPITPDVDDEYAVRAGKGAGQGGAQTPRHGVSDTARQGLFRRLDRRIRNAG